jgi:hypothetical protein
VDQLSRGGAHGFASIIWALVRSGQPLNLAGGVGNSRRSDRLLAAGRRLKLSRQNIRSALEQRVQDLPIAGHTVAREGSFDEPDQQLPRLFG